MLYMQYKLKSYIVCYILLITISCMLFPRYVFAYVDAQKAVSDNYDNTSSVEEGYKNLKKNVPNCRFCYAYDYDGDGLQEGYAISGMWEEGIRNGKLWFINSDGTYDIVKEGLNCHEDLLKPDLIYAGNQIFLALCNQMQNGHTNSIICGYRNGKVYFPAISEQVTEFHSEDGHYYAYNIADYSGAEYFYNIETGEFTTDIKTENIDIDFLYIDDIHKL